MSPVTPPPVPAGEGHRERPAPEGRAPRRLRMRRGGGVRRCVTEARVWYFRGPRASGFRVVASSTCVLDVSGE